MGNKRSLRDFEFAVAHIGGFQIHGTNGVVTFGRHLRHGESEQHGAVSGTLSLNLGGLKGVRSRHGATGGVVLHDEVDSRRIAYIGALVEGCELNGRLAVLDGLHENLYGIDLKFKIFVGAVGGKFAIHQRCQAVVYINCFSLGCGGARKHKSTCPQSGGKRKSMNSFRKLSDSHVCHFKRCRHKAWTREGSPQAGVSDPGICASVRRLHPRLTRILHLMLHCIHVLKLYVAIIAEIKGN